MHTFKKKKLIARLISAQRSQVIHLTLDMPSRQMQFAQKRYRL